MHFHDEVMELYGADVMFVNVRSPSIYLCCGCSHLNSQHGDLMDMLHGLVVKSGVEVQFGKTVLDVDPSKPSVTLVDGTEISGDVVIGVYGESSLVRPILESDSGEEEGDDKEYFADVM